jgi:hypothetical protein
LRDRRVDIGQRPVFDQKVAPEAGRIQIKKPYRVFDPIRVAILLIGGRKTGDDRWYATFVPTA